jgi:hypothetical protein
LVDEDVADGEDVEVLDAVDERGLALVVAWGGIAHVGCLPGFGGGGVPEVFGFGKRKVEFGVGKERGGEEGDGGFEVVAEEVESEALSGFLTYPAPPFTFEDFADVFGVGNDAFVGAAAEKAASSGHGYEDLLEAFC